MTGATIVIIGEPVGKARPRFSRRSGTVYTPSATKKKEQEIEKAWRSGGYMMFPKDVYLRVKIEAFSLSLRPSARPSMPWP